MSTLEIKRPSRWNWEGKRNFKGVNLTLRTGEIAAIVDGTGNLLCLAAIVRANYEVTKGRFSLMVSASQVEVSSVRMGLFLAMQYPSRNPRNYRRCRVHVQPWMLVKGQNLLVISSSGWKDKNCSWKKNGRAAIWTKASGGEKRNEILQLLMLEPNICPFGWNWLWFGYRCS